MRPSVRFTALNAALAFACVLPASARPARAQAAGGIVADLMSDVEETHKKFVSLAKAIPQEKYDWRPGAGVRSVNEVLRHVASDNYLIPASLGHAADASTGIKGEDYRTAQAFEARKTTKEQTIADLEKSFANLKQAMEATPASKLGDQVKMFGQPFTMQKAWVLGTTHLHEHLGQLIAYARVNGVKPPWS